MEPAQPPIATYADKSHFGYRTYVLFPDSVRVKIKSPMVMNADLSIQLRDLSADYDRIQVYSPYLTMGIILMVIGWVGYGVATEIVKATPATTSINFLLALGFMGLIVGLIGLRKQRLARFNSRATRAPLLDVFEHGPRKTEFQPFLEKLQQQIRACP